MSEILDGSRDSFIRIFAGESEETREEQNELMLQRMEALRGLSDEEIEQAYDGILEREAEIMRTVPHDELILTSDLKEYLMLQSLRYDMQVLYNEKVRRGLAPAVEIRIAQSY